MNSEPFWGKEFGCVLQRCSCLEVSNEVECHGLQRCKKYHFASSPVFKTHSTEAEACVDRQLVWRDINPPARPLIDLSEAGHEY